MQHALLVQLQPMKLEKHESSFWLKRAVPLRRSFMQSQTTSRSKSAPLADCQFGNGRRTLQLPGSDLQRSPLECRLRWMSWCWCDLESRPTRDSKTEQFEFGTAFRGARK